MRYSSTRNDAASVSPAQAVVDGLASDGGLYIFDKLERLAFDGAKLASLGESELYSRILSVFFSDVEPSELSGIIKASYEGKFTSDEITPLKRVGDAYMLELFHGPTAAFKDVALSFLPKIMQKSKEILGISAKTLVLTATSGDTGKAALEGFAGARNIDIGVFYPHGGVSEIQLRQMTSHASANAFVCGIRGNFDDAQTAVKAAFGDEELRRLCSLSSANSINIGRLAPQVCYYFAAYSSLLRQNAISAGERVNFIVPTGNFGDILAGHFARLMGLPIAKLICASNENNVLTDFIRTGRYDRRRELIKTASPSMDIVISSNLERLLYLLSGRDAAKVRALMGELAVSGEYTIDDEMLLALKAGFSAAYCTDIEAFAAIKAVFERTGYLMDTHTAVAWGAYEKLKREFTAPSVVLATASPYKFAPSILRALTGESLDGFAALDRLSAFTGSPVPKSLSGLRELPIIHKDIIERGEIISYIKARAEI